MSRFENYNRSERTAPKPRPASSTTKTFLGKAALAAIAVAAVSVPSIASAEIPSDRAEFTGYGRMGIGWGVKGQIVTGKSMNVMGNMIGGRLEEGDYLEPKLRLHLKKGEKEADTKVDLVTSFAMWAGGGGLLTNLANTPSDLTIVPQQAYIEAKDIFTPGLSMWIGSRLYRGGDIHIADYFYFNNLVGEGFGLSYQGFDLAVIAQTGRQAQYHPPDMAMAPPSNLFRQRTVVQAQYKVAFGENYVQPLAEFHYLPKMNNNDVDVPAMPSDIGYVVGAKLHLDLANGTFSDTSIRYGGGIANGAAGGAQTYSTFGDANSDGKYGGAYGIEFVEHFLYNAAPTFAINGYVTAHQSKGASDSGEDKRMTYAVGVRPIFFVNDYFHLFVEGSYSGSKSGTAETASVVKASIAPTITPMGERSAWTRPAMRLIYTAGFYNQAAVDQVASSYLAAMGNTKTAHYIGVRTEWWY